MVVGVLCGVGVDVGGGGCLGGVVVGGCDGGGGVVWVDVDFVVVV